MGRKAKKQSRRSELNGQYLLILVAIICILAFLTACEGPRGDAGLQGIPGHSPTIETLPASLSECLNGGVDVFIDTSETIICNGVNGATGPTGPTGSQGNPGVDATPVTSVQFCPNDTPSYPSTFPELGLCIDNNLYAVYSLNNGFLVKLIPGRYTSNAVGSTCSFTYVSGCTITP